MLEFIAANQKDKFKASFVSWSGDNAAHNLDDLNEHEVMQASKTATETIKNILGSVDPPLEFFPAIGNHDVFYANI